MTNQVDIGVLRGLHAASTQGEWGRAFHIADSGEIEWVVTVPASLLVLMVFGHNFPASAKADAAWAVAAHNALPALLDELERLRAALATIADMETDPALDADPNMERCRAVAAKAIEGSN